MGLLFFFWIVYTICLLWTVFLRFKMIYILEENGFTISKFASYITVVNKFSLKNNQHKIKKLRPKRMRLFITVAYMSYYLAAAIMLVVILFMIFNF